MGRKHTFEELLEICHNIRVLKYEKNWSDADIRKEFGTEGKPLGNDTYHYYLKKIWAQDRKYIEGQNEQDIPSELAQFEARIKDDITRCDVFINDPDFPAREKIEAIKLKNQLNMGLIKLKTEGTKAMRNIRSLDLKESVDIKELPGDIKTDL